MWVVHTVTTLTTAVSLGMMAIVTLLILLVNKEIISSIKNEKVQRLTRTINVALLPLMIVFVMVVGVKLYEVLS